MGLIDEFLEKTWNFGAEKVDFLFNADFWGLVGWTAMIAVACVGIAYFFPVLRSFCGAVLMSVAAMWFGYHKGQGKR